MKDVKLGGRLERKYSKSGHGGKDTEERQQVTNQPQLAGKIDRESKGWKKSAGGKKKNSVK